MAEDESFYAAAERRIEYLTLAIGAAAAIAAVFLFNAKAAAALAAGAALSWINYRWMKQGISALARLSTAQAAEEKPRVPTSVYIKFLGRYALLIIAAYAILRGFSLPAASFIAGLFAVVAAVLVEMIGQLFRTGPQPRADS
ncbi:MAG: ATP synthase subunit I [Candidatus Acidiferrales bacterium]